MGAIHHQIATSDAQAWDFEHVPVKQYTSGGAPLGFICVIPMWAKSQAAPE